MLKNFKKNKQGVNKKNWVIIIRIIKNCKNYKNPVKKRKKKKQHHDNKTHGRNIINGKIVLKFLLKF